MKKELTHNHKMTNILKTLIFSILMLAPFFAIGVKCWYVANNKNAKDSYTGSYNYLATTDLNTIISQNNLQITSYTVSSETRYYLESDKIINSYTYNLNNRNLAIKMAFYTDKFKLNNYEYNNVTILYRGVDSVRKYSINIYEGLTIDDTYLITSEPLSNLTLNGVLINPSYTLSSNNLDPNLENIIYMNLPQKIYLRYSAINQWVNFNTNIFYYDNTLSSVFYTAVQELDKASIFSWTVDTAIYTAVNNMCVALGIVSPPLAVLITYWTLLTIIYVVIDIVIEVFIFLTHWFNDKMV